MGNGIAYPTLLRFAFGSLENLNYFVKRVKWESQLGTLPSRSENSIMTYIHCLEFEYFLQLSLCNLYECVEVNLQLLRCLNSLWLVIYSYNPVIYFKKKYMFCDKPYLTTYNFTHVAVPFSVVNEIPNTSSQVTAIWATLPKVAVLVQFATNQYLFRVVNYLSFSPKNLFVVTNPNSLPTILLMLQYHFPW